MRAFSASMFALLLSTMLGHAHGFDFDATKRVVRRHIVELCPNRADEADCRADFEAVLPYLERLQEYLALSRRYSADKTFDRAKLDEVMGLQQSAYTEFSERLQKARFNYGYYDNK
jgi:hypothetical protein